MVKPFPCIFDVAADRAARAARSLRAGETLHCRLLPFPSFPFLSFPSTAFPLPVLLSARFVCTHVPPGLGLG